MSIFFWSEIFIFCSWRSDLIYFQNWFIFFLCHLCHFNKISGGCIRVNWLSQTRKKLTIEYLNLNFVSTPKLTPLYSFYTEKGFFLAFGSFPFWECVPCPSLFGTDILHIASRIKVFDQKADRRYFELVEIEIFLPDKM